MSPEMEALSQLSLLLRIACQAPQLLCHFPFQIQPGSTDRPAAAVKQLFGLLKLFF